MPRHATAYVALALVPTGVFRKRRIEWTDMAVNAAGVPLGLLTGLSIRSRLPKVAGVNPAYRTSRRRCLASSSLSNFRAPSGDW